MWSCRCPKMSCVYLHAKVTAWSDWCGLDKKETFFPWPMGFLGLPASPSLLAASFYSTGLGLDICPSAFVSLPWLARFLLAGGDGNFC
ncbi:unnamed protein product [Protopolystoma xenopodis]|uniref:Uncharacterized protein n=1 Tax=Protopolystoma xenopodis TaxID=117903 RepID=A0A3S5B7B0_9PLAT|nr:unnamed protein product [Protopolystoma xenopodis]